MREVVPELLEDVRRLLGDQDSGGDAAGLEDDGDRAALEAAQAGPVIVALGFLLDHGPDGQLDPLLLLGRVVIDDDDPRMAVDRGYRPDDLILDVDPGGNHRVV